jgi:hypothetical protein
LSQEPNSYESSSGFIPIQQNIISEEELKNISDSGTNVQSNLEDEFSNVSNNSSSYLNKSLSTNENSSSDFIPIDQFNIPFEKEINNSEFIPVQQTHLLNSDSNENLSILPSTSSSSFLRNSSQAQNNDPSTDIGAHSSSSISVQKSRFSIQTVPQANSDSILSHPSQITVGITPSTNTQKLNMSSSQVAQSIPKSLDLQSSNDASLDFSFTTLLQQNELNNNPLEPLQDFNSSLLSEISHNQPSVQKDSNFQDQFVKHQFQNDNWKETFPVKPIDLFDSFDKPSHSKSLQVLNEPNQTHDSVSLDYFSNTVNQQTSSQPNVLTNFNKTSTSGEFINPFTEKIIPQSVYPNNQSCINSEINKSISHNFISPTTTNSPPSSNKENVVNSENWNPFPDQFSLQPKTNSTPSSNKDKSINSEKLNSFPDQFSSQSKTNSTPSSNKDKSINSENWNPFSDQLSSQLTTKSTPSSNKENSFNSKNFNLFDDQDNSQQQPKQSILRNEQEKLNSLHSEFWDPFSDELPSNQPNVNVIHSNKKDKPINSENCNTFSNQISSQLKTKSPPSINKENIVNSENWNPFSDQFSSQSKTNSPPSSNKENTINSENVNLFDVQDNSQQQSKQSILLNEQEKSNSLHSEFWDSFSDKLDSNQSNHPNQSKLPVNQSSISDEIFDVFSNQTSSKEDSMNNQKQASHDLNPSLVVPISKKQVSIQNRELFSDIPHKNQYSTEKLSPMSNFKNSIQTSQPTNPVDFQLDFNSISPISMKSSSTIEKPNVNLTHKPIDSKNISNPLQPQASSKRSIASFNESKAYPNRGSQQFSSNEKNKNNLFDF